MDLNKCHWRLAPMSLLRKYTLYDMKLSDGYNSNFAPCGAGIIIFFLLKWLN